MTEPDAHDPSDLGSRAANQGKTEPIPPGAGDEEPGDTDGEAAERDERDVGADHPQGPRNP